ncbi:MAG: GWxTD domain-containing protein [Candidatus Tenebribacter davisii]|jgi:GWxTD domain-containing protein|nr:GWxTD domain-containing protein [Candidatus Tenebribacter davisii]
MKKYLLMMILFGLFIHLPADELLTQPKRGHIFDKLKDEYKLVNFFLSPNQKKYYKKLDEENKWDYISAFWKAQDPNPTTEDNEFLLELLIRIDYCNKHFSHFREGWKTDIGRIHIKHGKPFEILKLETGSDTKLTKKDYQIWKYRISGYFTYLFIDLQQHGDYRLIYSDGDEKESSWSDWRSYLGSNFDESLLQ